MNSQVNLDSLSDETRQLKVNLAGLVSIMQVLYLGMVVSTLVFYLLQRSWQHLGVMGLGVVNSVISLYAINRSKSGKTTFAAFITLGAVFLLFSLSTLFWSGASIVYTLTIFVFINALAQLILRRQYRLWTLVLSLGAAAIPLLLDSIGLPWQRYDVTQWLPATVFVYLLLVYSTALVIWRLIIAYQSIKTIGLRLSVTLAIGGMAVASLMGSASLAVGTVNSRNQVLDQLATAAYLKHDRINGWIQSMQSDLDVLFVENDELNRVRSLLDDTLPSEHRLPALKALADRLTRIAESTGRYDEIFLLNPQGKVLFSTDEDRIGSNYSSEQFLINGLERSFVSKPRYLPELDQVSFVIAHPITGGNDKVLGVVVARVNMKQLDQIITGREIGQTGVTYIVADNKALLTSLSNYAVGDRFSSYGIDIAVKQISISGVYTNYRGVKVLGVYQWIPLLNAVLIAEVDRVEIFRTSLPSIVVNSGVAILTTFLGVLLSLWIAKGISTRLREFAIIANRIAQGERELTVPIKQDDEIGALANAFNSMTVQLNTSVIEFEQRVDERTRGLMAAAEVSRATTSELDPVKLMPQVVNLVNDHFNLYYVGLFLVEDTAEGRYALLRAGTGDAGQQMLSRGWRLPVGGESMVGQCISTGLMRVKQSEQDTVARFDNPYLPDTRSELALPLHYGPRVIGAMTVQSDLEAAFDETVITLFQNMADQVAIVIENARLFAETQSALERATLVQQRYQLQAWRKYLVGREIQGFEMNDGKLKPLSRELLPEVKQALSEGRATVDEKGVLTVPIKQSGQVIGALGFYRTDGGSKWSDDQILLIQELAEQLALAAENQRLLDETQSRASREQLTREITEQIRSSLDVNTILQTAVREIGQVMGLEDLTIELLETSASTKK